MLISAIKKLRSGKLCLSFDGAAELITTPGVAADMRLYAGKELDGAEYDALALASSRSLARDRAIELLSRRRMSARELEKKLLEKGESEDAARYSVEWLSERGFIDDEGYAAAVARHYGSKGFGQGRVRAELSRRGVERELWQDAVDNMPDAADKLDKFLASRLDGSADREAVRKAGAALYRRGYSWDEIREALARRNIQTEED